MEQQLEFACAHFHWTVNDWSQVVWTDESLFELGKPVTQKQVWQTPEKKFDLDSMAVNHQSVEVSVAANCEELTLMEDGAPIHTALASQQWSQDHQIQKFAWPSSSPDLNPIENLWYKMKFVITNLFNPKTMNKLRKAIHIIWDTMPFNPLEALLVSMPARMQMVVDKNGAPTQW
ncbi:hypothetical protein O181_018582 [Austropuccinia psidii MF-1]|uniref:Tc1-like transposase DDE domain-containing protein n=1 Tax=Austropuccinia psidii MF-1 TaxID=1389203 RepID=A0A9Q3C850_9BASI|nr:hypothetical protein [Austropuccinia psidii MF-1]